MMNYYAQMHDSLHGHDAQDLKYLDTCTSTPGPGFEALARQMGVFTGPRIAQSNCACCARLRVAQLSCLVSRDYRFGGPTRLCSSHAKCFSGDPWWGRWPCVGLRWCDFLCSLSSLRGMYGAQCPGLTGVAHIVRMRVPGSR